MVVAPVPWFPFSQKRFGNYAKYAQVPREETRHGITVLHPRYLTLPLVGMSLAPFLMVISLFFYLKKVFRYRFCFEALDVHYFYPDGVSGTALARLLGVPVHITARGSDIHLLPDYVLPRWQIRWAASRAEGLAAVSKALKKEMKAIGIGADIQVLRNGVDLELFQPLYNREKVRSELGFNQKTLLFVGRLDPVKGHDLVIKAMKELEGYKLVIVGDGPLEQDLKKMASELNVASRVQFEGRIDQVKLPDYYGAADALVLASSREGWPNVLLESIACGTPVVASGVWGIPEVISSPEAGVLVSERTPAAFAQAIIGLFQDYPDRQKTREHAEKYSWDAVTEAQYNIFRKLVH